MRNYAKSGGGGNFFRGISSSCYVPPGSKISASLRTKIKIATAFEELLEKSDFEKITISDIADSCGISRQTFYNHFYDKNELVSWMYQAIVGCTTRRIGIDLTWEQAVRKKLEITREKRKFFYQTYRQGSYCNLANNEATYVYSYYEDNIRRLIGKELNDLESYSLWMYCHGATIMNIEWVKQGATIPVETILTANKIAMPPFAKKVFLGMN